ncbi:probable RNA-directed DNA polymerase from transposon X-element [Trichonephila clavipes]|nr:probable RNA-directed DNA polymerase from transposon X-element [Trichonephila clavipes]
MYAQIEASCNNILIMYNSSPMGLSLCSWNANGLLRRNAELRIFIEKHSPDIFLIQETHLRPSHTFNIANYTCHRNDRLSDGPRTAGGTLILVKNSLKHYCHPTSPLRALEDTNIILPPPLKHDPISITCVYIPSFSDENLFTIDIEYFIQTASNCILFGDFNASHNAWNCKNNTNRGRHLFNFANMVNLHIAFPSTPTRFGHNSANTIDIALIKNFYYPFTINSIDDLSSDHNPVFLNFLSAFGARKDFFKNKRPKIPTLNCATGTAVTDQQKANLLTSNIKNNFVGNERDNDNYNQNELINTTVNNFLSTPPTSFIEPALPDEIIHYIKHVNAKKALGRNSQLSIENKVLLYTAVMRPILAYASPIEKQLELEKVRKESEKNSQSLESGEPSSITDKLESLVKSIKTLTTQVPVRSDSFNLFFHSLEKAFQIKSVPDELKAEILLNILGERVNNLLTYVSQEDLSNYVKIKELILKEFEPTPQECLSNFKKARKLPSENYVQFASRLSATFDYYCQLRKVNEFRSLCDLIISDKIFETLDRDTMTHIATKQGETYFKPQQLGRECDVYLSARGKVSNDLMSRNPGSGVKTDGRNRLQMVGTLRRERNSSNVFVTETKTNCVLCKGNNFHPLSKCYQFKKLSVEDKVEVVKRNNLCFRCFLPHRLKECRSEKNCFCLRHHNSLIHFSRDKTRNSTPTSNLNLDAPTFVPGQIEGSVEANSQSQFVATGFEKGRLKNVFLSTVRALVKNKYFQWVEVRCLLDVGSQSCLCTRACAEKLQLKMEKINTVVSCVNDASMIVKNCVKTSVANKAKTFESELILLVVNKITDLIPNKVIDVDVNVSEFVPLADDKFNIPDRIDMLLGAEIFYELLKP